MEPSAQPKTRGDVFEGVAFTLCKAATLILITREFALPVAAGGAAIFFVLAEIYGKKDTRCLLMKPKLIAAFWVLVILGWAWFRWGRR